MSKSMAIHLWAFLISLPFLMQMLMSRAGGEAGYMKDIAMAMLAASSCWHGIKLRRLRRKSQ